MNLKRMFFLSLLMLGVCSLFGQAVTVSGTVTDDLGVPLPGVTILVEGTSKGTITDLDGMFSIEASPSDNLKFSFIGFKVQTITVGNQSVINVKLEPDSEAIEEVVVVGYGVTKKETLVGAVAQTKGETLKQKGAVANITNALRGEIPGVTVLVSTGIPGGSYSGEGDASEIFIRGKSTWNDNSPLILVDGVERDMNDVDINEIETFSVLKDASATAVFGVRGGNGVILITTKRGTTGKAKVTAEANVTFKTISKYADPVGSYEGLRARNYAVLNELHIDDKWVDLFTSERVLGYYRDQVDPEKWTDVDWKDEMTGVAKNQKYNVNLSGGTKFVKYFSSVGYMFEDDILDLPENGRGYNPNFGYRRFNFRTNLDFNITKTTQLSVNLSGFHGKQQKPWASKEHVWYGVYRHNPDSPLPRYSDGVWGSDDPNSDRLGNNSLFWAVASGLKRVNRTSLNSDFNFKQKLDFITKGLKARVKYSYDNF
ncbi:MAG: SusC/RagA family TonB-linked outer membrane protein, partial [Bacteroidales bacterium]|nr:SusC/RagA family TonB-linked outer membrane protein [Bacteroidales bacterium]